MTRPIEPQHLKRLHAQIRYALGCYKMHQQINGNGDTIDLVDVVTPPMEDNIAEGQIELDALAEHLVDYIEDYVKAAVDQQPPTKGIPMKPTEEMIGRFLSWKLPDDFRPDAGISYTKPPAHCPTPSGTNLFHYSQAKEMLEFVLSTTLTDRADWERVRREIEDIDAPSDEADRVKSEALALIDAKLAEVK